MNRTFIKVLPLAAAVLLATSCSKEDNNNEIVNNGQEKVEKQFKTITVKGNAGKKQGISKISLDEGTGEISFVENDEISFTGNGVSGKGKFIDGEGNFIADLTFTADAVVTDVEISATIGTALTGAEVCGSWSEIANYLYETSSATSTLKETEGVYEFESPFIMVPQIAILKNISGANATYKIGDGADQTLAAGSILVVMSGTTLTINGKTATVSAGNSYNIAATPAAPTVTGSFAPTTDGKVNYTISSSIQGLDLEYSTDGGTTWNNVSNETLEMPENAATLSFRTAKTPTSYASEATSAATVPEVLSVTLGNIKTFYYFAGATWQDLDGISFNGRGQAIFTDKENNRYLIFDNLGSTIAPDTEIDPDQTYTCKQILTIVLQGITITYYAGDTWQTAAKSYYNYGYVTVKQDKVYIYSDIICDNDNNPVNPNDQIDSNIDYQVQREDEY